MEVTDMTSWMRHVALLILLTVGAAGAARAEMSEADRGEIRQIIENQIAAFQRDDGATAYSYASPTIQGLFPTVDRFMAMVRGGYQPVYRPRSVTFGPIGETPSGPTQRVFLTGPDGRNWVAIYALERQPDGTWKINGCTLVKDDGSTA
jgi:Domain of unknown function (DUF4864)